MGKTNYDMIHTIPMLDLAETRWVQVRDGDPGALVLFNRHYSKKLYKDGRVPTRFVGPGERLVLRTSDGLALFVWRKFLDDSGQVGVNCAAFRNEGPELSSALIQEAEQWAWSSWPGVRLYTYVNPSKIQSNNPGYCFKVAGWRVCGTTKINRLTILEKHHSDNMNTRGNPNQRLK